MSKYQVAAKLDAAGARAWAIRCTFAGSELIDLLPRADRSLESVEQAAVLWRKDIAAIRSVLREIEGEQPRETAAPCAFPGCAGLKVHELASACGQGHEPNARCHPHQTPEKKPEEQPYDGPRYASGEQPMVGDIAYSDFGSYYTFVRPGRYYILDKNFVRELHIDDDLLRLVRRAEVEK